MKVLLAVGDKNLSQLLRRHLEGANFELSKEDVLHRSYLEEIVDFENPDLLIIHDRLLPSDQIGEKENEEELLGMVEAWRRKLDTKMRVVIMCERDRKDPFLAQLVSRNVLDIFNERQISSSVFVEQLKEPAKYMNVSRYGMADAQIDSLMEDAEKANAAAAETETEMKSSPRKRTLPKFPNPPQIVGPRFKFTVQTPVREDVVHALQERKIILVVSPYERSGSTFVSHQLAYAIAKEGFGVRYFENPFKKPYTFDRLAGHVDVPAYFSSYSEIPDYDESEYTREWVKDGVGIQALNPTYEQPLSIEQLPISRFLRHLLSAHDTPYLIVDIGADTSNPIYDELIEIANHLFVVVDNDMPRLDLFDSFQFAKQFDWIHNILSHRKAHVVANRYVKGIEKALPECTYSKDFTKIPSFDDETIFQAQLKGTFKFDAKEAKKRQEEVFQPLLKLILEGQKKNKRKGGLFRTKNWLPRLEIMKES